MLRRRAKSLVQARLKSYPAVALLGARQAGKTTLARALGGAYFDLELPEERTRLDVSWNEVTSASRLVVLDEAQNDPGVFARLRGAIDQARKKNGRFLLLGSVSPALMRQVAESLAGRIALCELTPLLLTEIGPRRAESLWLRGGYPDGGVLGPAEFPAWQQNYLNVLAQRDLPNWGLPATSRTTALLFKMLAAVQGQVWNASDIGRSLGLSYHTVNTYAEYLENAYLIRLLPAYHKNIRKRLVKSPKVYWRDSGLLHALMGVESLEHLYAQPWVGASWEGWVIEQILGHLASRGAGHQAFYFRTQDGLEIDLVLELGRELWAVEVKFSTSPSPEDFTRLNKVANLIGADRRCIISRVKEFGADKTRISANLRDFLAKALDPVLEWAS